jgi:crotonobetainyl-CoA:carnitine CoA-transferase CaiB-like acyl-CoA transferase
MASFLSDVRIVSFSTGIAGPNAARLLANYGAEVFKIESRAGGLDAFRSYGDDPEASPRFVEVNLNTRSLTLNLKKPDGVALVKELIAQSDVVMENFRPDVMPRLGLAAEELRASHSSLIVVRMPGLGSTGPLSHYGTWGPTLTAYSGLTYLWNLPNQSRPVGSQGVYPDYLTGVMAPLAVIAALLRRRQTGEGAVLELAQVEAAAYMLGTTLMDALVNGREPKPTGNDWPYAAPHNCYRCQGDDRWCVIAIESDQQWRQLCEAMGEEELGPDPRFATVRERRHRLAELDAVVTTWTSARAPEEVMRCLQDRGVPCGVVQNGADLANDEHLRARGFIETVEHPILGRVPMAGLPLHFTEGAPAPFRPPPALGADNEYAICALLGHSRDELAEFEREEVVF